MPQDRPEIHGIQVQVIRHPRAKRMRMRLDQKTGDLTLTLPPRASMKTAKAFLRAEQDWIFKQQAKLLKPQAFIEGNLVPIRGVLHKICRTGQLRGLVEVAPPAEGEGVPLVQVPGQAEQTESKLIRGLKRLALEDLTQAVSHYRTKIDAPMPKISLRDTKSRWGSCSSSGTLSFSWRLILAPSDVLNYVAAHEVAHLREMNHGLNFWALVSSLFPGYKDQEKWLKGEGAHLHSYGTHERIKRRKAEADSKSRFFYAFT